MADKVVLDFVTIAERLQGCDLPAQERIDRVVGIGTGGVVPAALVAYELGRPLTILTLNYRAPDNSPRYDAPRLLAAATDVWPGERLLLVDDVSVSGKTLATAVALFPNHDVTTLVMKGQADIVLFPEIGQCVHWPWHTKTV